MDNRIEELNALIEEIDIQIRQASAEDNVSKYVDLYNERNNYVREKLKLLRTKKSELKENINRDLILNGADTQDDVALYKTLLINAGIATQEEVKLVCDILGCSVGTLEAILHIRTGYATFDEYTEVEYREDNYFDEATHTEAFDPQGYPDLGLLEELEGPGDQTEAYSVEYKGFNVYIFKYKEDMHNLVYWWEAEVIDVNDWVPYPNLYSPSDELYGSYKEALAVAKRAIRNSLRDTGSFNETTQVSDVQRKTSYPKKTKASTTKRKKARL